MKLAITAKGREVTDQVDPRFGRAKFFVTVDTESGEMQAHDNAQNLNAAQGAGIQAAQNVAALNIDVVITGNVGPKAFRTLNAAGIKIYLCGDGSVAEALENFKAGGLKQVTSANVEGHW